MHRRHRDKLTCTTFTITLSDSGNGMLIIRLGGYSWLRLLILSQKVSGLNFREIEAKLGLSWYKWNNLIYFQVVENGNYSLFHFVGGRQQAPRIWQSFTTRANYWCHRQRWWTDVPHEVVSDCSDFVVKNSETRELFEYKHLITMVKCYKDQVSEGRNWTLLELSFLTEKR